MSPIVTVNAANGRRLARVPAGTVVSDFPNRPSGLTEIGDLTWTSTGEAVVKSGWSTGGTNPRLGLVNEAGPFSAVSLRATYPAGIGSEGVYTYGKVPNQTIGAYTRAYACKVWKLSPDFVQHPSNVKFMFPFSTYTDGGGFHAFSMTTTPVGGVTSGQWKIVFAANGSGEPVRAGNTNDPTFVNDVWYRIEVYAEINSSDGTDGIAQWWVSTWNGSSWGTPVLCGDYSNVRYPPSSPNAPSWATWDFEEFFGGSAPPSVPVDQYSYTNRLYVAFGA